MSKRRLALVVIILVAGLFSIMLGYILLSNMLNMEKYETVRHKRAKG